MNTKAVAGALFTWNVKVICSDWSSVIVRKVQWPAAGLGVWEEL